jgi:hypothetical protein
VLCRVYVSRRRNWTASISMGEVHKRLDGASWVRGFDRALVQVDSASIKISVRNVRDSQKRKIVKNLGSMTQFVGFSQLSGFFIGLSVRVSSPGPVVGLFAYQARRRHSAVWILPCLGKYPPKGLEVYGSGDSTLPLAPVLPKISQLASIETIEGRVYQVRRSGRSSTGAEMQPNDLARLRHSRIVLKTGRSIAALRSM